MRAFVFKLLKITITIWHKHTFHLFTGNDGIESGFPLSRFLKERTFKLGNTARNLASQSIHRISDIDKVNRN